MCLKWFHYDVSLKQKIIYAAEHGKRVAACIFTINEAEVHHWRNGYSSMLQYFHVRQPPRALLGQRRRGGGTLI
jgi:hypothetical protein